MSNKLIIDGNRKEIIKIQYFSLRFSLYHHYTLVFETLHCGKLVDFKLRMLLLLNERRYQGDSNGISSGLTCANFDQEKLSLNLASNQR